MAASTKMTDALKYHFGFEKFKGNQESIISGLLANYNIFVLMPTGGGKSLCYQLPALMSDGTAIVVSPLIALMKNQVDTIRHHEENDNVAHFLNSTLSRKEIKRVKESILEGTCKLLYVAPESLTKQENIDFLKGVKVSFYAIDEAHCISEWGHDFRPEYRRLRTAIDEIGSRPVIALTATATPKVQSDILENLRIEDALVFKSSFNRENLYYEVRPKTKEIDRDIVRYIKNHPGQSGIIYCLSRKKVEELAEILKINDIECLPYHAGLDPAVRASNQDAFLHEKVDVIVATIAFGMGIDKPDVRFVIHYDIPKSLEGYYQETGRAGRDGGKGECIAFYNTRDLQKLDKIMQIKNPGDVAIMRQLLYETANYAESSVCRRKIILHYFGEEYPDENCGKCDNCLNPRTHIDATEELHLLLELLQVLDKPVKPELLADILLGRIKNIENSGDPINRFIGVLEDSSDKFLRSLIRQSVFAGYLKRDIELFGSISITVEGEKALESKKRFSVVEDIDYSAIDYDSSPAQVACGATDPVLFAMLKNLRKSVARRHGLPPYVIFQEPSLEAMATYYPVTKADLLNIQGVGAGKAARYGDEFLKLIGDYVVENEILRPEDIKVKLVGKTNNIRIAIIQSIDRKLNLEVIADSKRLELDELITELEHIVANGTKIDITYHLREELDDDQIEDMMDYFRESEEDDIEEAYRELGADYTEDQIRLARIKFISEMGN